jgi:hypothetical protein
LLALLANFIAFGASIRPAHAQFRTAAKQWVVLDFANNSNLGGPALGGAASDAVSTLLLGTNRFDILPRETVERIYRELELTPPITRELDILRVGQALSAEIVITGEIKEARINAGRQGKSADVVLVVRGIDVSSGYTVLGAAVKGQSTERPGDVADDVVLNDAVNYAAQKAVDVMLSQQVDIATVLTTPTTDTVQLNKGSRQGIKLGMEMVVTRGREQVAMIRVVDLATDSSTGRVLRSNKGVAPGDRARAIYNIPNVTLNSKGDGMTTSRARSAFKGLGSSATLMTLLVVGALAVTIGGGGGDMGTGDFRTEASTLNDGITPGVKLSWTPNIFSGGRGRVEWHVWRSDYIPTPVVVVPGPESSGFDTPFPRTYSWRILNNIVGTTECEEDPGATPFDDPAPGVIPGTTYLYQLSLVYKLSALDVPGGTGGGGDFCFFQTARQSAVGPSTPVTPVDLLSPPNGATDIGSIIQFSWNSTPGADQYVVEISTQANFANANNMRVVARVDSLLTGGISSDPIDFSAIYPSTQRLYWRVGARNSVDVPGPVRDKLGERYVFSRPFQFDRIIPPPPPPGMGGKGKGTKGGSPSKSG